MMLNRGKKSMASDSCLVLSPPSESSLTISVAVLPLLRRPATRQKVPSSDPRMISPGRDYPNSKVYSGSYGGQEI
jgi:hypothetical protein